MVASKRNFAVLHSLRRCIHMQMKINKFSDTRTPQPADAHTDINYKSGAQQPAMVSVNVHLIQKVTPKCL